MCHHPIYFSRAVYTDLYFFVHSPPSYYPSYLSLPPVPVEQNRIGEMQHAWLVAACGRLGLTRFVLPQPIVARLTRPRTPTDGVTPAPAPAAAAAPAGGGSMGSSLRRRSASSRGDVQNASSGGGGVREGRGENEGRGQGGGGRWRAALKAWWDGGEAGKDEEVCTPE